MFHRMLRLPWHRCKISSKYELENSRTIPSNYILLHAKSKCTRVPHDTTCTSDVAAGSRTLRPFPDIPGPRGLPFLGTLLQYRFGKYDYRKLHEVLLERYRQFGPVVKETIAGDTCVHLFDPEDVKYVYRMEGKTPEITPLLETALIYRKKRDTSLGLGNFNGEEWYRLRSAVQALMLRPKSVGAYIPLVESVADDFIQLLPSLRTSDGVVKDMMQELGCWNLESGANTLFERRLGYLTKEGRAEADRMISANTSLFALSAKLQFSLPLYKLLPTPTWSKLMDQEDYYYSQIRVMVDSTVERIHRLQQEGKYKGDNYDFLGYLLSCPSLDYNDVIILCLSLFTDGLFTTRSALIYSLYQLAVHPQVQELAYREAEELLRGGNPITQDTLNQMKYIKAVVKETFRFMPIGLSISRVAPADLVIQDYHIPKGTKLDLNLFVQYKNPKYFEDPEEFRPERWLRGESGEQIDAHVLQPFGHGPRMCAGRRFSEQEMYILLAKILQRFRIEWHGPPMGQHYQILVIPDCPTDFTMLDRQ